MKKIIVTGCNGQLGRAINREYEKSNEYELVNTDVGELDITDVKAVLELTDKVRLQLLTVQHTLRLINARRMKTMHTGLMRSGRVILR